MRASHKFGCPNDFVRKVYQDRDFRQKVLHANEVSDGKADKGFAEEESAKTHGCSTVEVVVPYEVLNERELMKKLGLQRLPKYIIKDLPTMVVPSVDKPGGKEVVFAFAHPARRPREVFVRHAVSISRDRIIMKPSAQLFPGHSESVFAERMPATLDFPATLKAYDRSQSGGLLNLSDFLHKAADAIEKQKSKSSDNKSDGGDEDLRDDDIETDEQNLEGFEAKSTVTGLAADLFGSPAHAGKKRPIVPGFDTPTMAKKMSKLELESPSVAGGASVNSSGGADDEEQEDEDEFEVLARLPGTP